MKEAVILFHSTNHAMWASDVFKGKKIKHKMIPVPRNLSSDCGYCLKIDSKDKIDAETVLTEHSIEFDKIVNL